MTHYTPSQEILQKYARVLVNFALNSGEGIKKGEVVRISASESAKPLFLELRRTALRAGAHVISHYIAEDDAKNMPTRDFYELASDDQLSFFPKKYLKGLSDQLDHTISIISTRNKHVLQGIDPQKILATTKAMKPYSDWLFDKENINKFTWTLGLYGTAEMAKEAGLTLEQYWQQIIDGCFLQEKDPIAKWKEVSAANELIRNTLTGMKIEKIHMIGPDVDLWIAIGNERMWKGGGGRNIPSFEIFTSPNWRGTNGWIKFNQPLYVYGNLIKDVELEFKNGIVTKSHASHNYAILKTMIATKNADKVGEFSLTDGRFSHITHFMAETLYDENMGGPQGNTHIALGRAYNDCFTGQMNKMTKKDWDKLGFNDSAVHTDIVSTAPRKVEAFTSNGSMQVIYDQGQFKV